MKKHYKKLTQEEFELIRSARKLGTTRKQIESFTGRVNGTLSMIFDSKNWEDYKAKTRANWDHYKKQTPVKEPVATLPGGSTQDYIPEPAPVYTSDMQELTNEVRKLRMEVGRLVNAWEARPEKKGIFG